MCVHSSVLSLYQLKSLFPTSTQVHSYAGRSHLFSVQFQREHVLGTCSRYTPFLVVWTVLKSRVPARTVPAGTRSNHVLRTNRPLSTPPKRSLNDVKPRTCSKWAGIARRPLSAWRVHLKMTSHVAQCIGLHNKSYCADRDVCWF